MVKKATLDRSALIFEAWVHPLQQNQHTHMMMAMKTKHPDTDNPTVILYELLSVSVSEKEKKYDKQSKHLIQINWKKSFEWSVQ